MMKTHLLVAILCQQIAYFTPVAAQQLGSVEAARIANRADAIQREMADSWRKATKLRVDDSIPIPNLPVQGEQPKDLQEGQVEDLAYWNFKVLDLVSPTQTLLIMGGTVILLDGHPNQGLVSDQSVRLVGPVRVRGTYQYETNVGQATVRVVRFLSAKEVAAIQQAEADAAEAKLYREFTDSTGQYKFLGKFVEYKSGQAHFVRKDDGKTISVKLSQLSAEDRKWVADEIKTLRAQAKQEKNQSR